ncbi:MAG: tetratricopeptide (TPR) repeat protein [Myxococcota bacterium]|jgi:tetratricopeptide (TPR) repeat protein
MFGLFKSIKRTAGFDQENKESGNNVIKKSSRKLSKFVDNFFSKKVEEFKMIFEKSKDLSTTNYNLGMKYLDEGNLKEAIFRFKVTKKFWPENYEACYQLAVCLMLDGKTDKAKKVIDQLIQKAPHYQKRISSLNIENIRREFMSSKNLDKITN